MTLVKVGMAVLFVVCFAQDVPYFRRRFDYRNKNYHAALNRVGPRTVQNSPLLNRVRSKIEDEEYCDEEDANCPIKPPNCGDKCMDEGKKCHYDPEDCCEEKVHRTVSECKEGAWNTSTKASCEDDPCPGQCPVNVPNTGDHCSLDDLECKYMESTCCEQTIFGVTALCVELNWKVSFNWKGIKICQRHEENRCEKLKGSHGFPPDDDDDDDSDETFISESYDEYKEDKPPDEDGEKRPSVTPEGDTLKDIFDGIDDYPHDSNEAFVLDNIVDGYEEGAEAVTPEASETETISDIFAGLDDDLPLESENMNDKNDDTEDINAKSVTAKADSEDPEGLEGERFDNIGERKPDNQGDYFPGAAMDKTSRKECPLQPPMEGSRCGRGFYFCQYDQDDCCVEGYNHLKAICYYGQWMNQWSKVTCEKTCENAQSTFQPYQGLFGYPAVTTSPTRYWNYPRYQLGSSYPYQGLGVETLSTNISPNEWSDPDYPVTVTTSSSNCPQQAPQAGERCWSEDSECKYGTQNCCGQEYPKVYMLCTNGEWKEELYQTPCAADSNPCPMMDCPSCLPQPTDKCQLDQDVLCKFDEQECCGVMQFPSTAYCKDEHWHITKTPTTCDQAKPCPNNICPEAQPKEGESCELHREVYCFYDTVTCCDGKVSHKVHASCQESGVWRVETKAEEVCDTNCDDDGGKCPLMLPGQDTACSGALQCHYHAEQCCGEVHHAAAANCSNNTWSVTWNTMTCRVKDCDLEDPGPCPLEPPELFTDCASVGLKCVYLDEPCCSQVIMCDGNNWLDVSYPAFCEQDAACSNTSRIPKAILPNYKPGQKVKMRPSPRSYIRGKRGPMNFMGKKRPMKFMKRPFPKRLKRRFPRFKPIKHKHKMPRKRTKKFRSVQFLNRNNKPE